MKGRLTEKGKILSKEELLKMADDMLVSKSEDMDLKVQKDISPIIVRNIKALKKLADMEGLSVVDLIKLLKNE
jgi:ferredoxin-fold anticodon binding domain-containing protein